MIIHHMEKMCFDFLKLLYGEPHVKVQDHSEKEVEYYQTVLKRLVGEIISI